MSKKKLPQYGERGVTNYCFKCQELRVDCKCEGGFKICFYKGVPLSAEELKDVPKWKSPTQMLNEFKESFKELGENITKILDE